MVGIIIAGLIGLLFGFVIGWGICAGYYFTGYVSVDRDPNTDHPLQIRVVRDVGKKKYVLMELQNIDNAIKN